MPYLRDPFWAAIYVSPKVEEYLRYGEKEILHRLFSDIIFRDILVRYGIRETKTLAPV